MYNIYLKHIGIDKVRHLRGLKINISENNKRHLIITGKNGSGKTSVLNALSSQLNYLSVEGSIIDINNRINTIESKIKRLLNQGESENRISDEERQLSFWKNKLDAAEAGLSLSFSVQVDGMKSHFEKGEFILAFYGAKREFNALTPKHVEKVILKNNYAINDSPRNDFLKYILDLKMTEALSKNSGKTEKAQKIHEWFDNFEKLLKKILEDDSTQLLFDEDSFKFSIYQTEREPFDFQSLSDGYAAIMDIIVDLIVRMEKHTNGVPQFDMPGIVLIDEIETHLHLELQRKIWSFLTSVFPNLQFIVSTHSPVILSNADNATIFDLEKKICINEGLTKIPYDGIVKGYFEVNDLSEELQKKFNRYKEIVTKKEVSEEEIAELPELEFYLDEIPDYLALEVTTEYARLKAEFENREES